jgi:tetratricopeptide (TPR) repeat protein
LPLGASGCGLASSGLNAEGTRYFEQGHHAAAIRRFEQAIATNPQDGNGYYNLAATYHQLAKTGGDATYWNQAEIYYNQCLERNPDHAACYRGLSVLLVEQNKEEKAFKLLEGWRDRSPFSPDPKTELARLYREFGNSAEEERQLLEAIAADPGNSRALAALGTLREEQGDYAQALKNYQLALQRNYAQPQLQARVAALSSAVQPAPVTPSSTGTRTVTVPAPTTLY